MSSPLSAAIAPNSSAARASTAAGLRLRLLSTALLRATRELFAYVRYLSQVNDESGVQFLGRQGRQVLLGGLVFLDGGDPTRGTVMLVSALNSLAHIGDDLEYVLE
jgi:hypothetical protein